MKYNAIQAGFPPELFLNSATPRVLLMRAACWAKIRRKCRRNWLMVPRIRAMGRSDRIQYRLKPDRVNFPFHPAEGVFYPLSYFKGNWVANAKLKRINFFTRDFQLFPFQRQTFIFSSYSERSRLLPKHAPPGLLSRCQACVLRLDESEQQPVVLINVLGLHTAMEWNSTWMGLFTPFALR